MNDGNNAGRACWVVAGTLCGGNTQGTFAQKLGDCHECEFYHRVGREQRPHTVLAHELLRRIEA